jgi:pyruvate formate lyase activating enzyme
MTIRSSALCRRKLWQEILKKARRYKPYFKNGGGVTFSGGEPLLQSEEIVKTVGLFSENGIGYVLDTSLSVPLTESVKKAIIGADMILADLKFPNEERMKKYASGTLSNTLNALEFIKENGKRLIIRTVVVPNINDSVSELEKYLPIVERFAPEYYELLPFHTMGFFKYLENGIENPLKDTPPLDPSVLDSLKKGLKTNILIK